MSLSWSAMSNKGDRRAVFIDRDGTLIEDAEYLSDPRGVDVLPGSMEALRRLNEAGLPVVLVTNQSGIAQGLLTIEDFEATQRRLTELMIGVGAHLDGVYMCPHHPDIDGPCDCRKPGAALYRRAADELCIDLSRSFYVGDRYRDVAVTEEVGGVPLVVLTGEGGEGAPGDIERVRDLAEAVDRIVAMLNEED